MCRFGSTISPLRFVNGEATEYSRLSGYWFVRYDEGSVRELYRCGGVFPSLDFFYVKHRGKKTAFVENIIPQPEEREKS